jgi:AcrR family transcriptional regulator
MPRVVPEYKERARARIVDAAAAVFRRQGLPGGTMDDIAREIGVSKGALYLYFPTKTRLLEAVQAKFRAQYTAVLEDHLTAGDVAEGIVGALEGLLSGEFDPSVYHRLVIDAKTDPAVREALRADAREDRRNLLRILRRLEREGRIARMADPVATTDAVLLLVQGAFSAITLLADRAGSREQLLRSLRLVLGAAGRRPRPSRRAPV